MYNEMAVSFIFEKRLIKDGNISYYSCIPFCIMNGNEYYLDENCSGYFLGNKKNPDSVNQMDIIDIFDLDKNDCEHFYASINDTVFLENKYVYAFPYYISKSKLSEQEENKLKSIFEQLKKCTIYQMYDKQRQITQLFIKKNNQDHIINSNSFFEIECIFDEKTQEILSETPEEAHKLSDGVNLKDYEYSANQDKRFYADEIYNHVKKTVICQDEQIKTIATVIAKNSIITNPSLKSNLLVCGPTGVGKSEIFRNIASGFDIPITIEDSTEYTAASFKGKDVIEILEHLLRNAHNDIEKAQKGIVVIDEIDKKVSTSHEHETFTSAVINSFLKMMEGHTYYFDNGITFDTSYLTFAVSGAFSEIEKFNKNKKMIGFNNTTPSNDKNISIYNEESLKKYGLLPEFIGRCDTLVTLNELSTNDLIKIINESNKSQLLLYKELFNNMGIELIYDDKVIEAIAKKAVELKLGARSIKKIVEQAFSAANYELLSNNTYKQLIITPETIEDNKNFQLIK